MLNVTHYFLQHTSRDKLKLVPEVSAGGQDWSMFNDGSVEMEVGEFIYSLVRMIKPKRIVETGTHYGISAAYMAQAMIENGLFHTIDPNNKPVTTMEILPEYVKWSDDLWASLGVRHMIECRHQPSLDYVVERGPIDILFLDSEPKFRYDEFIRFFDHVKPGGFIFIHDLHPHLSHSDLTTPTDEGPIYDWPFGDFRPKLGQYIKEHRVQTMSFPTPRGFTMFQKEGTEFGANKLLRGEW